MSLGSLQLPPSPALSPRVMSGVSLSSLELWLPTALLTEAVSWLHHRHHQPDLLLMDSASSGGKSIKRWPLSQLLPCMVEEGGDGRARCPWREAGGSRRAQCHPLHPSVMLRSPPSASLGVIPARWGGQAGLGRCSLLPRPTERSKLGRVRAAPLPRLMSCSHYVICGPALPPFHKKGGRGRQDSASPALLVQGAVPEQ